MAGREQRRESTETVGRGGSVPLGSLRLRVAMATLAVVSSACTGGGGRGRPSPTSPTAVPPTFVAPKVGGSLTVGTEAEVTSGFDPFSSTWDTTGLSYAATIFDPLVIEALDGSFKPYLAQSVTPAADYSSWTIKARSGITFSDGESLNADALVLDFQQLVRSSLTGPVLNDIADVKKVDDLSIQVTMKPKGACPLCGPWTDFDAYLASQLGYVVAPRAIADPQRASHPIGTGPFIFKEWVPGDHFTATRNPHYWRKDAQGVQLPYLDQVRFKPIVDPQSRESSLLSGTIQLTATTDAQAIADLRAQKAIHLVEQSTGRVEVEFVMLNTSAPPLDDVRIRQALAMSLDRSRYNQVFNFGLVKSADGPFSDRSGFTNAPGYPAYNPAMARQLVQRYEADHHTNKVEFEFGTTTAGRALQGNNLIADMWSQVGINAHVVQTEQSQYILRAVQGRYNGDAWRSFGETDPGLDAIWWASDTANEAGATNLARNNDRRIDADLADARASTDPAKRRADYEDVSARLNQDLPYLWTAQALWVYAAIPTVRNVDAGRLLPDGSSGRAMLSGVVVPTELWLGG